MSNFLDCLDELDEPDIAPPFAVMDYGESATIIDQEGRELMFGYRAKGFVRELCSVMNENSERLVKAWKKD